MFQSEPIWMCTQIHTCTYHCMNTHTPTINTCPVAKSSNISRECFSQNENGHKMNEYSDLIELLRNFSSCGSFYKVPHPI